ncbi:MAG: metal-binding protein [Leptolyngbya sp.]|nr:MAG: metal-binding protein [Leptolyngbya sp.]
MNRRGLIAKLMAVGMVVAIALLGPSTAQAQAATALTVYRSPTCNCCGHWVDHMQAAGFAVEDVVTDDMEAIKTQYGVPEALASCHTALVEGYVIEGHVPASDVRRLLSKRPAVLGIAAPGMPVGSPGMETGDRVDPYTVVSFTANGETATFAEHP